MKTLHEAIASICLTNKGMERDIAPHTAHELFRLSPLVCSVLKLLVQEVMVRAVVDHSGPDGVVACHDKSQTDTEGNVTTESSSTGVSMEPSHFTKTGQPALEELTGLKSSESLRCCQSALGNRPVQPVVFDYAPFGEDPEARRLRTVKNIADLRQNLEETMSSLRGTQVTHSTLETTFDTNVTTEMSGRSILSLTGRPTPLSWRLGQSSPRLQAGDAPSMGNGYPPRANASRFINTESGRYVYSAPLRRQLASRGSSVCHVDVSDKAGDEIDLEGISMDAPGYMSDGDVLSKNIRTDDITSG
ncbi:Neuron navigator 2 [Saguinus oedipus]|uniref:Neuron navigator 2 n=1 Tax=Saguinus oedipus TaxID=9490 RepID=A0ABQ9UU76_SAGOE|nr:Neuron navigator 2 [Saguinus oedipus]